jgi:hypothetical protein
MGPIHAVLIVLTGLAMACSTIVDVSVNAGTDLSSQRTWSWQTRAGGVVDAPRSRSALSTRLDRAVERELTVRGYQQVPQDADLRVMYHLSLQPRSESVQVPRAPYLLSSMSSSASYWIEGTDVEQRAYQQVRLGIHIRDPAGRELWSASLSEKVNEGQQLDLDAEVATLLRRLPDHAPAKPDAPPR